MIERLGMRPLRAWVLIGGAFVTAVSAAGTSLGRSTAVSSVSSTTSSPAPPASKTSSAPARTITVQVGNGDHKFKPDVIQANIGDTIEFTFYPQNHSVIRAEYEHPCIPYEMTGPNKTGFYSGFHAVDAVLSSPPTFSLLINDTLPTFFYCSAPSSCTGQGMVGVINPNATTSLAHQRDLALKASYQLSPGEPFPSEGETPSYSTAPSPGANPTTKSGGLSPGAIAGIVLACVGVLVLGAAVFWFWGRLKGLSDEVRRKESTVRRVETRESWFPATGTGTMSSVGAWEGQSPVSARGTVPPSYFEAQFGREAGGEGTQREGRRSAGGTFGYSPVMGRFEYRSGGTSDMTSPVDPGMVGGGGMGGLRELQRLARSPERQAEGYPDEKGIRVGAHVNRGEAPAEMEDTSARGNMF